MYVQLPHYRKFFLRSRHLERGAEVETFGERCMLAVNYLDTCWSWADNRVLNGLTVLEKDVLSLSQPLCKVVPPLMSCFYLPVLVNQP